MKKDMDKKARAQSAKKRSDKAFSTQRENFLLDLKFRHGDSRNQAQWPEDVLTRRKTKPCLTLNIVQQHNLQIINAGKAVRSAMQVVPTGDGATKASADCIGLLIARIESQSEAPLVYDMAREFQVDAGVGYWRIQADYMPGDVFEQDLFLRGVPNPMLVRFDPDAVMKHGGDGKFVLLEEVLSVEDFKAKYPQHKHALEEEGFQRALLTEDLENEDEVRVCEFIERVPVFYTLISFIDPATQARKVVRKDMLPPEVYTPLLAAETTKTREVTDWKVEWTLFVGDEEVDTVPLMGRHLPVIRVPGQVTFIDGIWDFKSHTRSMLDGQRMYNYNASAQVEHVALQTKVPWVGPAEAIRDYEQIWRTANTQDHTYLPFRHVDEDQQPIPAPVRPAPPMSSPAFTDGMQTAFNQLMMTSGQWQNQMGMMGNERTGSAIQERQEQGDIATYHFQSHFEQAQAWTTRLLIEMIPEAYDTERMMTVVKENDDEVQITLDPQSKAVYEERQAVDGEAVQRVLNPMVGRYDVKPTSGADFASRRAQTVQALTTVLTQAPALTAVLGDLMLEAMNFKEAREAAARMRRMVPPQALGQGPSPQEQQLQQNLQAAQGTIAKLLQQNAAVQLKLDGRVQMRDIDAYKAETDRIKALGDSLGLAPEVVQQLLSQLGQDTAGTPILQIAQANSDSLEQDGAAPGGAGAVATPGAGTGAPGEAPPHPEAQKGQDGEWYLRDPSRVGKYMRIESLASQRPPPGGGTPS